MKSPDRCAICGCGASISPITHTVCARCAAAVIPRREKQVAYRVPAKCSYCGCTVLADQGALDKYGAEWRGPCCRAYRHDRRRRSTSNLKEVTRG